MTFYKSSGSKCQRKKTLAKASRIDEFREEKKIQKASNIPVLIILSLERMPLCPSVPADQFSATKVLSLLKSVHPGESPSPPIPQKGVTVLILSSLSC